MNEPEFTDDQSVFVYGTLKSDFWNNRLLTDETFCGSAETVYPSFKMFASGIPYVVKSNDGSKIVGELYSVSPAGMRRLDALEGHPRFYRREQFSVKPAESNSEERLAWMYVINDREFNPRDEVRPTNGKVTWNGQ